MDGKNFSIIVILITILTTFAMFILGNISFERGFALHLSITNLSKPLNLKSIVSNDLLNIEDISSYKDNLYLIGTKLNSIAEKTTDIILIKSKDNGNSFTDSLNLIKNNKNSTNPVIAVSGSNLYAAWTDYSSGNGDVYFVVIKDNGTTLTNPIVLGNNNILKEYNPKIAISGSSVYVSWITDNNNNVTSDIYLRTSTNNGTDFGKSINLSNNSKTNEFASNHSIHAYDKNLYLLWEDRNKNSPPTSRILFSGNTTNGITFEDTKILSNNNSNAYSPEFTSYLNNVYVIWQEQSFGDVLFRRSIDNGSSFEATKNISNKESNSSDVKVDALGNNVYIIWTNTTYSNSSVLFKRSTDNGLSFGGNFSIMNLNNNNTSQKANNLDVAAAGQYVNIIWKEKDNDLVFIRSKSYGDFYSSITNATSMFTLSSSNYIIDSPRIFAGYGNSDYTDSGIYLTWRELESNGHVNGVYFSHGSEILSR